MTTQEIRELWGSNRKDPQAAVEWWNNKAPAFSSKELPAAEESLTMRLIRDNNMLSEGQSALDVGCGGGRFSFALEQLGALVIGTDFSPNMIEECIKTKTERASAAEFCALDWHDVSLAELDWNDRFDLVLANMTPAVDSADSFLKLSEASRNWCLVVKPTRRSNAVLDRLTELLGIEPDSKSLDETLLYSFELLWLYGRKPKIEYEEQCWENSWQLDEALREYTLRLSASHALAPAQKEAVAEFLRSVSADGIVKETTHTTIAAIFWQV